MQLKPITKEKIVAWLRRRGYQLVTNEHFTRLSNREREHNLFQIALALNSEWTLGDLALFAAGSKSQLGQDLFALLAKGDKKPGYFVEFGATNGVDLSNTYLLEKEFGWQGILAEPARTWQMSLRENRDCIISNRCVWSSTGDKIEFLESSEPELSTVNAYRDTDAHSSARQKGSLKYSVDTISLRDLLVNSAAPKHIDFLSIDTEGSELQILEAFDFSEYTFGAIAVEHNYTSNRELIQQLLGEHGYVIVLNDYSYWDDWYVNTLI